MTTHDLAQAQTVCTRLCLLNRTVIADGPPDRLADPELWLRAFGVTTSEQLIAMLARPRHVAAQAGPRPTDSPTPATSHRSCSDRSSR
jgi:ABC-type cobalamin/Fe3+-siderophores transport system ATPase subunit